MPSSTVSIGFKPGDFFYNTSDTSKNADLLATFPFGQDIDSKNKLVEWANDKAKPNPPISSIDDIFDPQISTIILNPKYDFQNTFLPGNMTFNGNFDAIAMGFAGVGGSQGTKGRKTGASYSRNGLELQSQSRGITGNIVLTSKTGAPLVVNVNQEDNSKINWKQDITNSWEPNFDISAKLSKQIPFVDSDGGISSIIVTSNNPRCKYREKCTMNHWHYSGECKTQIKTDAEGKTTCKCMCTGIPVFNADPHSHCDDYTINEDGTATTAVGTSIAPVGLGLISTIQNIKLNLKAQFPNAEFGIGGGSGGSSGGSSGTFGTSGGNVALPYKNAEDLKKGDEQIRQLVFDYYYYVNENRELQKTVQQTGIKDSTMRQNLIDATVQYKNEYLNVFNIVAGIFGVAGYIYLLSVPQT